MTHERFDFKGNLLEVTRRLASAYDAPVIDWSEGSPTSGLEEEAFRKVTEYDALSRMTRLYNWHNTPGRVAVYEPRYNRRGLLEGEALVMRAARTESGYVGGERTEAISEVAYNEKGQRERIRHGNSTITRYDYDPKTFRLTQLRTTRPGYDPDFPSTVRGLPMIGCCSSFLTPTTLSATSRKFMTRPTSRSFQKSRGLASQPLHLRRALSTDRIRRP